MKLINLLCKYSNLPYNLYGQDHKVSLISVKWQRAIIGNNTFQEYLPADKIFRKAYV